MVSLTATGVHFSLLASFSFSELVRCFQFLGMDASRLCSWWVDLVVVLLLLLVSITFRSRKMYIIIFIRPSLDAKTDARLIADMRTLLLATTTVMVNAMRSPMMRSPPPCLPIHLPCFHLNSEIG